MADKETLRRLAILAHSKYDFGDKEAEQIADNLPAEYFNNFCQMANSKEEFWKLYKEYVTPKRVQKEFKKDSHYRLPLTIINDGTWAKLIPPAQALLPAIGCMASCYMSLPNMAQLVGYNAKNLWKTITPGLKQLEEEKLIDKYKSWPTNVYQLTDKALHQKGRSFFPIYWYQIKNGRWGELTASERAFYVIAGMKGTINHPLVDKEEGHHCIINLEKIKRFRGWAGLTNFSYARAKKSLIEKELLIRWKKREEVFFLKLLERKYLPKEGKLLELILDKSNGN